MSKMFSWMNPKLEVKKNGKFGKGIFANKDIKKEEILFVMGGYILTVEDDNELGGILADKAIEVSDCYFIGPRKPSDLDLMPQHYVNHSCNPNAGFKGQISLVAMRKIPGGGEVTYDYGMVMYPKNSGTAYFGMKCFCGTKKCRDYITEDDWKIPELQKKYDGYFSWYLQEKINKAKGRNGNGRK